MQSFSNRLFVLFVMFALGISAPAFGGEVVDGVSDSFIPEVTVGNIDFDPPSLFMFTLPLLVWVNTSANAIFIGTGAVLDVRSFDVTGYSEPNALCWNSGATNSDGSVPALPEYIAFIEPVFEVSMMVGSYGSAGQQATLVALNSAYEVVDIEMITLDPAMQNLSVDGPDIAVIALIGPRVMVADDFSFN